ncbi:hypothetical protein BGT96224_A20349 [Blumeria graminis f. sp. tritici 96224]|nr:hypothetical protein BGT96224_A20349 [Blumeria graminis f. sp. tritici 96224]
MQNSPHPCFYVRGDPSIKPPSTYEVTFVSYELYRCMYVMASRRNEL